MKANARHAPVSTRSCGTPLSRSPTPLRRFQTVSEKPVQDPHKSDHFCECEIFNCYASSTYNFNTLKWTSLQNVPPILTPYNQNWGKGSNNAQSKKPVDSYSFSLGEKVRMRDKLVHSPAIRRSGNKFYTTVQNGTKRDEFHISQKRITPYQRLTTAPPPVVPFCGGALSEKIGSFRTRLSSALRTVL
jgi:hypothetical protein